MPPPTPVPSVRNTACRRFLPPPAAISADLTRIDGSGGERLDVSAQAVRSHKQNLGLIASDYEQPFATFSGTLPGGVELTRGWGVMERHSAKW